MFTIFLTYIFLSEIIDTLVQLVLDDPVDKSNKSELWNVCHTEVYLTFLAGLVCGDL